MKFYGYFVPNISFLTDTHKATHTVTHTQIICYSEMIRVDALMCYVEVLN